MPRKRHNEYDDDLFTTLCQRIAQGESLRKICEDESMPSIPTVFVWMQQDDERAKRYARAREVQADVIADEVVYIADNEPDPHKARVRMDARRWYAGKVRPKVYGERLMTEDVTEQPLRLEIVSPLNTADGENPAK